MLVFSKGRDHELICKPLLMQLVDIYQSASGAKP